MSMTATITQIETLLKAMSDPPRVILISPREFVNMAEFPAVVLEVPDNVQGTLTMDNRGWSRNQYPIKMSIFLGSLKATPYDQLNDRALAYIDKLRNVIKTDNFSVTGSAVTGKDETDQIVIAYTKGIIPWGDNTQGYYGLVCQINFLERFTDWN